MYIIHVGSCCTLLSMTIGGHKICIVLLCLICLNAFIPHFHWLPSSAVTISGWLFFIRFLCTNLDFIDGLAVLFQNSKVFNLVWGSLPISLLPLSVPFKFYSACFWNTERKRGVMLQLSAVLKVYMLELVLWHSNVLDCILFLNQLWHCVCLLNICWALSWHFQSAVLSDSKNSSLSYS